jgi:ribonuclease P protein component
MERLRHRKDFVTAKSGVRVQVGAFELQVRKRRGGGPIRVGFTVTKRIGNAVERNRVRRRLREVVRLLPAAGMRPGHDYVLLGRRAALAEPFDRMLEEFTRALARVHAERPGAPRRPAAEK